ncbi:F-box protein of unknown function [Balamuthia mandrillaris]
MLAQQSVRHCDGGEGGSNKREGGVELNDLGEEMVFTIFTFLDVKDLVAAHFVCHKWARISSDDSLWKQLCFRKRKFLASYLLASQQEHRLPWKQVFRFLYYPFKWSEQRKNSHISVQEQGKRAIITGTKDNNNFSIHCATAMLPRDSSPQKEPFHYYEFYVEKKGVCNIGFGVSDLNWDLTGAFVGFNEAHFNYGYTSNGKMKRENGFTCYGEGDRVGMWVEYPSTSALTLHFFLNGQWVHTWDRVSATHCPPLFATATLYRTKTSVLLDKPL